MKIKEIIVVEGKDDVRAVKRAVEADFIITSGFMIKEETFQRIQFAREQSGVIIFTDPDYAGDQIRKRINKRVKGCKNAYLPQKEAIKKEDIGIENAKPESIREALSKAHCTRDHLQEEFSRSDLLACGLIGAPDSSRRRDTLGKVLGIGYTNSKQLLVRLNSYGITREQFMKAVESLDI